MLTNKISIIMPVYNADKYLELSISSVLKQDYKNFELIIVNDGSTDKSAKICERYLYDSRVKFITQLNSGPSRARNTGLKEITGDYLMFLDADDYLERNALTELIDIMNNRKVDLCIYAWKEFQGVNKTHYFSAKEVKKNYEEIFADIIYYPYSCGGGFPWNKIWRVESIKKNNKLIMFDEELYLYEDKLWSIQNLNRIKNIAFLNQCIYNYRVQAISLSHANNNQLDKLYHSYIAAKKINEYINKNHYNLHKYAEDLEWTFKLNYLFGVRIQKKTGNISSDYGILYQDFKQESYRNLGFKLNVKFCVLKIIRWLDGWRECRN